MIPELEIWKMGFKVGLHMKNAAAFHCNFVSDIPFQMTNIVSMQQLPQASIRYVFIEQKIRATGLVKPQQPN